jgi:hypothetical protein
MPAGALRESVTFQRQAAGSGTTLRNQLAVFADIADAIGIPAELTPLRYGETVIAQGVQGRRLYVVKVRYTDVLAGIRINDRMVDARVGTVYNVKSPPVNPDKKRKYLEIQVETGGASG